MTDSYGPEKTPAPRPATPGAERRQHHHLRELIDEMLATLRAAANRELISTEERADAERQLAQIMERVRAEAVTLSQRTPPIDQG